jgi:DNA repair protein RadC
VGDTARTARKGLALTAMGRHAPLKSRARSKRPEQPSGGLHSGRAAALLFYLTGRDGLRHEEGGDEQQGPQGMLQQEFNYRSLMVKDESGRYRPASGDEIIEAALSEINRRFARGIVIDSVRQSQTFLNLRLARFEHEVFAVLWLDNKHRVLAFEELFRGTINSASVHPREVVKSAMRHNAAACILCHNHPSGVTDPSRADETITHLIKEALKMVEVNVLDHLIVGESPYSFAEHGLL